MSNPDAEQPPCISHRVQLAVRRRYRPRGTCGAGPQEDRGVKPAAGSAPTVSTDITLSSGTIAKLVDGVTNSGGCDFNGAADDRLRRATWQEDGEPGWRFKIRKPLLMSTGQIWQGRVYSRPRGRDRGDVVGMIDVRRAIIMLAGAN